MQYAKSYLIMSRLLKMSSTGTHDTLFPATQNVYVDKYVQYFICKEYLPNNRNDFTKLKHAEKEA